MPNPLQLRCNQLERSMRALHDECDRLMRENAQLRERMQGYGAGQTIHRIDEELARIAARPEPDPDPDPFVVQAASLRLN